MNHNKLITQKARENLKPLGFVQSGKSRIWYKDNGWWSVVVEFQPSSHTRGTYVNVSVSHFFYESAGWAFHIPNRLPGFANAEDDSDFEHKVDKITIEAATLASHLLEKYKSVEEFISWYSRDERRSIWDDYYCGLFKALSGNLDEAKCYFQNICDSKYDRTWEDAVQRRAGEFVFLLSNPDAFKSSLQGIVLRTRNLMCLDDYKEGEIVLPWAS
ncbi:DUF4304 domain-containing protein [Microbulbifer sp. JMSA002]|uniref:DUF4304 domain-containing protein n=1 Tax=Microbulbifer sp. JMSA002 TaxID=3243368 RepID=UPI00403A54D4